MHDIAIVGAGPVGIELAIALQGTGLDAVHLEAGQIGETMLRWPPRTRWFSSTDRIRIAGVPIPSPDQEKCLREEYLAYLRAVVQQFDLDIRTYEPVTAISRGGRGFTLTTRAATGETHTYAARRVALATGGNARRRRLDIPGEDLPHVHHALDEPHRSFGKRLVIVGGRNSAIEAALRCHRAGARVTVSYRGTAVPPGVKYWLRPEFEHLVDQGRIDGRFGTIPVAISPGSITLRPLPDGQSPPGPDLVLPADFVVVLIGYDADMSLFRMAGVTLEGDGERPVHDERTMETDVPGVYVAGTAMAGTQRSGVKVFLENCHVHVDRIVAALTGAAPPAAPEPLGLEEA